MQKHKTKTVPIYSLINSINLELKHGYTFSRKSYMCRI